MRLPCARQIDIDTLNVDSPRQPAEKLRSPRVSSSAVVLMIIIVATLALVAILANVQRLRRGQVEKIVLVPAGSATPQPH
ncbi:MAG: hypothetical protein J2P56_06175 [Verrucomicrobia bacterium]|nr:hypothetical protein [Verrucomicrobiota bacterium]